MCRTGREILSNPGGTAEYVCPAFRVGSIYSCSIPPAYVRIIQGAYLDAKNPDSVLDIQGWSPQGQYNSKRSADAYRSPVNELDLCWVALRSAAHHMMVGII